MSEVESEKKNLEELKDNLLSSLLDQSLDNENNEDNNDIELQDKSEDKIVEKLEQNIEKNAEENLDELESGKVEEKIEEKTEEKNKSINTAPPKFKACIVCEKEKSSYKCPKCRGFYCSLACFKIHKEKECEFKVSNNTTPLNLIQEKSESEKTLEEEYILLNEEQKNIIKNDQKILDLIKSKRFLNDLAKIDEAEDRESELKKLRLINPEFNEAMEYIYDQISSTTTSSSSSSNK